MAYPGRVCIITSAGHINGDGRFLKLEEGIVTEYSMGLSTAIPFPGRPAAAEFGAEVLHAWSCRNKVVCLRWRPRRLIFRPPTELTAFCSIRTLARAIPTSSSRLSSRATFGFEVADVVLVKV